MTRYPSPPRPVSSRARLLAPIVLAVLVFVLAYVSPVEDVGADPAIALLSTQAFLDHGTWRLDPYQGDPRCAYDFENDYRIRRQAGDLAYYNLSVPVLSLPAVWLANRFGMHMLDQRAEFALQNLLSALCCALIAALLYALCRCFLGPVESFALTAVVVFGSSLTSTLATGLWNLDYAVVLLAAALLYLVRARTAGDGGQPIGPSRWAILAALSAVAFLCRPTTGFAVAAAMLTFGVLDSRRRAWRLLAAGAGLAGVLAGMWALGWIPEGLYYTPRKLVPRTAPWVGLYGNLLSPSRGLLLFSPFVILIAAGAIARWRSLWRRRLFRFASLWIVLQLLAVSVKQTWWGGHSYGPRLLTELALPWTLIACLAWRELDGAAPGVKRRLGVAFVGLGLVAAAIHSGQGLFNPMVQRWNVSPDVDRHPEVLFDWRTPQFLATEASVMARLEAHDRRSLLPYRLGDEILPDSPTAIFRGWYASEGAWRWSEGHTPELVVELDDESPGALAGSRTCLLRLTSGTRGFQAVTVSLNGKELGHFVGRGFEPVQRLFAAPADLLAAGDNVLRFDVPGAAPTITDGRILGLALRSLTLTPLPSDFDGIAFDDDLFFESGWSDAEDGWRWSDGVSASLLYPVGEITGDRAVLEIHAGALGRQVVTVRIDGVDIGKLSFEGAERSTRRLGFDARILRSSAIHRVELEIPGARSPGADPRRLGLSLVHVAITAGAETAPG